MRDPTSVSKWQDLQLEIRKAADQWTELSRLQPSSESQDQWLLDLRQQLHDLKKQVAALEAQTEDFLVEQTGD